MYQSGTIKPANIKIGIISICKRKRMRIHLKISFILFSVFSLPSQAEYNIGIAAWTGYPKCVEGFKDKLGQASLIENENVNYIHGKIGASKVIQTEVAQGFKNKNLDLVFSLTTSGTAIFKDILHPGTPIVFAIVTYPADSGLIDSFDYSGNNLVGTSNYVPLRYSINLLTSILPSIKKAAIFYRKGEPNSKIQTANLKRLLNKENIKAIDYAAENLEGIKTKGLELSDKVDVFITTTDTLMQDGGEDVLIDISLEHKIPILSSNKTGIENGATFGVVVDFYELCSMSGELAVEILVNNKRPTQLTTKLQEPPIYLVNKKSINHLGIYLNDDVVEMIEWVK